MRGDRMKMKQKDNLKLNEKGGCGKMLCNPKSHNPKTCKQKSHICGELILCDDCKLNGRKR